NIVGNAVFGILVGTDIDAHDAALACALRQTFKRRVMAFIIEAEAIDNRSIFNKAENARARIAALRTWCDGADFSEAETKFQQCIRHFGILVITGGHAKRIWELQSSDLDGKSRIVWRTAGHKTCLQARDGKTMCL